MLRTFGSDSTFAMRSSAVLSARSPSDADDLPLDARRAARRIHLHQLRAHRRTVEAAHLADRRDPDRLRAAPRHFDHGVARVGAARLRQHEHARGALRRDSCRRARCPCSSGIARSPCDSSRLAERLDAQVGVGRERRRPGTQNSAGSGVGAGRRRPGRHRSRGRAPAGVRRRRRGRGAVPAGVTRRRGGARQRAARGRLARRARPAGRRAAVRGVGRRRGDAGAAAGGAAAAAAAAASPSSTARRRVAAAARSRRAASAPSRTHRLFG